MLLGGTGEGGCPLRKFFCTSSLTQSDLQPYQKDMTVLFWYLVKNDDSVRYFTA